MEPLLAGVRLVAVNPPDPDAPLPASILLADRLPLKCGSMRGVVVGAGLDAPWLGDAVAAVLPGLRVVAEGAPPALPGLEVLAQGGGAWVGRRA
jgi:hypothetical protein